MTERIQHTNAFTKKRMAHRYGDTNLHKHDKRHSVYRLHWKTHPANNHLKEEQLETIKNPTNLIRTKKKEKMWKRLAKASFH